MVANVPILIKKQFTDAKSITNSKENKNREIHMQVITLSCQRKEKILKAAKAKHFRINEGLMSVGQYIQIAEKIPFQNSIYNKTILQK